MRRRALLAASMQSGGGNGLEFPLYLNFDYCEKIFVMTYCYGEGDYAELRRFLVDVCKTHYDHHSGDSLDMYSVYEDTLNRLGIEIYVEGNRVVEMWYEGAYEYVFITNTEGHHTKVMDTYIEAEF